MARLSNTFEGGTDDVSISTGNSGSSSGTAWNTVSGAGTGVYDDDAPTVGAVSAIVSAGSGQNRIFGWTTSWATKTEVFIRMYLRKTGNPAANTVIAQLLANGVAGVDIRITTTGTVQMRDGSQTARYTSSALANDTLHRLEFRVVHSTTVGRLQGRIFSGSNVHGTTPDEEIGSGSSNWNTAASSNYAYFGIITSPGGTWTVVLDEVAIDDTAWIGTAVTSEEATALPYPVWSWTRQVGTPAIDIEWTGIEDADDGYEFDLYKLAPGGNPADDGDWTNIDTFAIAAGETSVTLDAGDGVEAGATYRGRMRALTTDDNS